MKIAIIVGARPNLIKAAPLLREFAQYPEEFEVFLIHTGQHSSFSLSRALLHDLEMPEPDFWLSAGSGSHASQTAAVLIQVEDCLMNLEPDLVLVFGDVNSTMGAAIVANKLGIKVGHIEAGLRCFDSSMPEEVNRLVTDHISDFLFVSEHSGLENLMTERIPTARIFYTGNIMIDSLIWCLKKISNRDIPNGLKLKPGEFGVLTLHRPSNVDSREVLTGIFEALVQIAITLPIIFPCHPRTRERMVTNGILTQIQSSRIKIIEPLSYLEFINVQKNCRVVFTDSGGVQEETTFLGIPCLTLRDKTERPSTVDSGTNVLCGNSPGRILEITSAVLSTTGRKAIIPELWDGCAAQRIVRILRSELTRRDVVIPSTRSIPNPSQEIKLKSPNVMPSVPSAC
jgi:UDP-N-acetylglucosamine 2-epimerase (non-hydrolysing)